MKPLLIGLLSSIIGCRIDGYYFPPDGPSPGETLWVKQLGGNEFDQGKGIAIDNDNNLVAVGSFRQTLAASSELTSHGEDDIYVVKLNSSTGNVIWAKRFGGTFLDSVFGVAVDGASDIYVGGNFAGSVDFGGGALTSVRESAAFVLKLDANGNFKWARKIDGGGIAGPGGRLVPGAIATDGAMVIVANNYTGSITIDTNTHMSAGSFDMFALKLSASTGDTIWGRSFGGTSADFATDIAFDSGGNVVLTGAFTGAIDFGGGPLSSTPNDSGFLLKLANADGSHLLSRQLTGSRAAHSNAVAVDSMNNIFIAGSFQGHLDLGCANALTSSQVNQPDAFLVKYTQAGACIWSRGFGGASGSRDAVAIALSNSGDVAVLGDFCGSISFDEEIFSSASACGDADVFTARFASDGTHLGSVRTGGTSDDRGFGIAQSSDGRVFMTGHFKGFAEFGHDALNATGDSDAFIVGFAPL
jgi:hypothetical protein